MKYDMCYNVYMKNIWIKLSKDSNSVKKNRIVVSGNKVKTNNSGRHEKITNGAKDFAVRFEGVMKELANG